MSKNMTSGDGLNSGGFEMERMLRQNAHEKAFEIQVIGQRSFEQQKERMVYEQQELLKSDQNDKINKLNQDLNIARSKKINASRLKKMEERNLCLNEMKEELKKQMQEQVTSDRSRYLATVENIILQSMVKMIEPTLQVKCRKDDLKDISAMVPKLEKSYTEFMNSQTGKDDYACKLIVLDDNFLSEEQDQGCGGVILYTSDSKIVCPNTLVQRLHLSFEELLPEIRQKLFPGR